MYIYDATYGEPCWTRDYQHGTLVNSSCLGYPISTAHCSLMTAAVTGACITHLSKRLSSTHPLSAGRQHHSLTTHILTCSQIPLQTCRHTSTVHIFRHCSHYGDKFCLSWVPSVSHGVVWCTSPTPPSSAFHRWICRVSEGLSDGHDCRTVWLQIPCDRQQTHPVFPKLWGVRGRLRSNRSQVNHRGSTGLIQ